MTPLAHLLVKDSLLPSQVRKYGNAVKDLGLFDDLHFFECSSVWETAFTLGQDLRKTHGTQKLAFLPAPRTFIEFATLTSSLTSRFAFLLEEGDNNTASVRMVVLDRNNGSIEYGGICATIPLLGSDDLGTYQLHRSAWRLGHGDTITDRFVSIVYVLLAMINTPRIIMREQHMPHRGLEKRLSAARGMVGKFPLQGWTELVLKVQPPRVSDGEPQEAHLTGARALHFCRCHLRIRMGMLELVTAHWRGDPALGIKRTRYRIEPGPSRRVA